MPHFIFHPASFGASMGSFIQKIQLKGFVQFFGYIAAVLTPLLDALSECRDEWEGKYNNTLHEISGFVECVVIIGTKTRVQLLTWRTVVLFKHLRKNKLCKNLFCMQCGFLGNDMCPQLNISFLSVIRQVGGSN